MNQLKQFKKQHTDKKIKTSGRIYMLLVLLMFIIVIVDSFEHDLPFYYILYGFVGIIIGRFVAMTQDIILLEDKTTLSLKVRPIGMVITFLLGSVASVLQSTKILNLIPCYEVRWKNNMIFLFTYIQIRTGKVVFLTSENLMLASSYQVVLYYKNRCQISVLENLPIKNRFPRIKLNHLK